MRRKASREPPRGKVADGLIDGDAQGAVDGEGESDGRCHELLEQPGRTQPVHQAVNLGARCGRVNGELADQSLDDCLPILPGLEPPPNLGAGGVEPVVPLGLEMENDGLAREMGGVHVPRDAESG